MKEAPAGGQMTRTNILALAIGIISLSLLITSRACDLELLETLTEY